MLAKSQVIIIMLLISCLLLVNFRTYHQGRRLAVLGFMMAFITLMMITQRVNNFFLFGVAFTFVYSTNEIMLWHHKFGHLNFLYLKRLFPSLIDNKNLVSFEWKIFKLAKHTHMSFPLKVYIPSTPFSLIHSDIWGPSKITTCHGKRWFLTFIDDHTRITWVYLLHNKSEASHIFKVFHKMIQTQFQTKIRVLRTNNGK